MNSLDYLPEPITRPALLVPAGEVVQNLSPPDWLVRDMLERDSLAVLYGEPGHGKSFLALDLAASVATGRAWHGHPVQAGAVIYIAGEGRNGMARRLKGWEIKNGTDLCSAPLAVSTQAVPLDNPEHALWCRESIREFAKKFQVPPVLVVVDTLARNFAGDENSTKEMNTLVRALDDIRREWSATVLIVHHTGKDTSRGARGSSVLKAAVDAEYSVAMDELKVVALQAQKMKEAELPALRCFKLEGVPLPIADDDGNTVWSCAPVLLGDDYQPPQKGAAGRGKNQTLALQLLANLYREHEQRLEDAGHDPDTANVRLDDWQEACRDAGIDRRRFSEVKTRLEKQDRIEVIPPYVRLL